MMINYSYFEYQLAKTLMLSEYIIFSIIIKFLDKILARIINKTLLITIMLFNALSRHRQTKQTRQHRTSYNLINYLENNSELNESSIMNIIFKIIYRGL